MRTSKKSWITLLIVASLSMVIVGTHGVSMSVLSPLQGATLDGAFSPAYTPHDAIWIDGNAAMAAQAAVESWPGNGSAAAPFLIAGYYFDQYTQPLRIWNTDLHWRFVGNDVDGDPTVQCGTWITNCSNGAISGNVFHYRHSGMWLEDLTNFNITNNVVSNNRAHAIEIAGEIEKCIISGNTIESNLGSGIRITSATDSVLSGNQITDCDGAGIQVLGASTRCELSGNQIHLVGSIGIQLGYSTSVTVQRNRVTNCSGSGIYMLGSFLASIDNNTVEFSEQNGFRFTNCDLGAVTNNSVKSCLGIGILVSSGSNSSLAFNVVEGAHGYSLKLDTNACNMTVSRNSFCYCEVDPQICDDGTDNIVVFNYYSEWTSPDQNDDDIVDEPYVIDGSAGNNDPYPLASPDVVPTTPETTSGVTGTAAPFPLEVTLVAGGAAIVIIVGLFFARRRM
jgi:parallel beta-helix repeat protein